MSGADLRSTVSGETYALIADLSLQIDSYGLEPLSEQMTAERTRRTTLIRLVGDGEEGVGEDATPIEAEQLAFQERGASLPVAGQWTIDSFSAHVSNLELIPPGPHERARSFRQWGFESAALDLALRQAGRSLADVLGRACRPVTFVNSMHLPEPPSAEPIRQRLHLFPGLRLKLDPTTDWDERLIAEIAATGAVVRKPQDPVRGLRLLRGQRHRDVRRRLWRARRRPPPSPVPRLPVPPRRSERCSAVRLQPARARPRAAHQPDRRRPGCYRLPVGGVTGLPSRWSHVTSGRVHDSQAHL
jgi:hypothetical protein